MNLNNRLLYVIRKITSTYKLKPYIKVMNLTISIKCCFQSGPEISTIFVRVTF